MGRGTEQLERIFAGLYPRLHAYAMGLLLDRDGAEDVCQEAFLKAHELGEAFLGLANPRAYLYAMVRNRCLDRCRSGASRCEVPLREEAALSAAYSPEGECLQRELDGVILAGMATLTLEARELLLLKDVEGLRYKGIAALCGIPLTRVRWVLREARQKLKTYVEANYGGD